MWARATSAAARLCRRKVQRGEARPTGGGHPIYPSYHMYQALAGVKAAYEKAIRDAGGSWPRVEAVIKAFQGIEYRVPPGRTMTVRADHNGIEPAIMGVTKHTPEYPFAILDKIKVFSPEEVNPPLGVKTNDWIDGWGR